MDREKPADVIARETAPEPSEPLYTARSAIGVVKRWRDDKGHGVIAVAETAPWDVWCHFSHIEGTGYKALRPGERVGGEFYRANQESFKYVAHRVRRLEAPPEGDAPGGA